MENFIVKIKIETLDGKPIKEAQFETLNIMEVKAFGQTSLVDNFVVDTIKEIRQQRRENPHHHQNRID